MRIAIEATLLVRPPYSGIARSTGDLIEALATQSQRPTIDLYYQGREIDRQHIDALNQLAAVRCHHERPTSLRKARHYDIAFASYNRPVPKVRAPSVLWLHDFYLMMGIGAYDELSRRCQLLQMQKVYTSSQHFICISEATRRDAIRLLRVPDDRLHVVPQGISGRFHPTTDDQQQAVCRQHALAKPFLLFAGLFYENKNLPRLLAGYARSKLRASHDLAIVGPLPAGDIASRRLSHLIEHHQLQGCVRQLGWVPDNELVPLYGAAAAFVFPSLYEGFGMPILEAMRCGTPVLTSNVSACPEVAGGHAELVDPYDIEDICRGLEGVVHRNAVQREAARLHAGTFSWAQAAQKMMATFEKIAGKN